MAFSRIMVPVRGLYPIVDLEALERARLPALAFAREVLRARPELLQLRAKAATAKESLWLLRGLRELCLEAGTHLIVNDRADLALLAQASGVHVGQHDLPIAEVRRLATHLLVGVSTHSLEELQAALETRPSYVAIGPVFPTNSKRDTEPVLGLETVRQAAALAEAAGCPLYAIGGLRAAHLPDLARLGVGAALIGALIPSDHRLESVAPRALELAAHFGSPLGDGASVQS